MYLLKSEFLCFLMTSETYRVLESQNVVRLDILISGFKKFFCSSNKSSLSSMFFSASFEICKGFDSTRISSTNDNGAFRIINFLRDRTINKMAPRQNRKIYRKLNFSFFFVAEALT